MIPPLMSSTMSSEDVLGKKGESNTVKTQDNSKGGRPEKEDNQKSEKTIANKEAMS